MSKQVRPPHDAIPGRSAMRKDQPATTCKFGFLAVPRHLTVCVVTSAQALIGGCDAAILAQLGATPILPGQRLYLSSAKPLLASHGLLRAPQQVSGYQRLVNGNLDQTVCLHPCFN